jgi:UDP-3-O-[3-hydroxymyristoyl] glucosamine N-acyltransferase
MKPIVFVGHRQNLHDVLMVAKACRRQVVGLLDKYFYGNTDSVCGVPVIGADSMLEDTAFVEDHDFFLTSWWTGNENLNNPEHSGDNLRKTRIDLLDAQGIRCTNLIHPDCTRIESSQLGNGIIAMPYTAITDHCVIGDYSVIDWYALVGHDCRIGRNVIVGARATLAGGITVEDNVRIGLSATVVEGHERDITLHKNSKIWAGAVVFDSVPENANYTHNHRILKRINKESQDV